MTEIEYESTTPIARWASVTCAGPAAPPARRTFADYLQVARHAWTPEVVITPAWVRRATGCSRGLSSRLAAALAAEHDESGTGVVRP